MLRSLLVHYSKSFLKVLSAFVLLLRVSSIYFRWHRCHSCFAMGNRQPTVGETRAQHEIQKYLARVRTVADDCVIDTLRALRSVTR